MPVRKVDGGWKWGNHGKVYPTREQAEKQGEAAYANGYTGDTESRRVEDINGWFEVEGNPLSKVGVFQYSGKFISADLPQDELFWVYRPKESLSDPETIDSFKLVPWTNDHPKRLLGDPDQGGIAPEDKGIEGVIGERVYFDPDDEMLKGNIKVFSRTHADRIASGKEELSVGYRSKYEYSPGTYKGQPYQYVQTEIRGNHLASVDHGRMGPDVAVLDGFTFTIDHKEIFQMRKTNQLRVAMGKVIALGDKDPEIKKLVAALAPGLHALASMKAVMDADELKAEEKEDKEDDDLAKAAKDAEEKEKEDEEKKKKAAEDEAEEKRKADEVKGGEKANKEERKEREGMDANEVRRIVDAAVARALGTVSHGMDAKEMMVQVGQRDKLAEQLSHFIGTFDASEMTHAEVASYGLSKLGIQAAKGTELATLTGYLHGRQPSKAVTAMDSKESTSFLKNYLAPAK